MTMRFEKVNYDTVLEKTRCINYDYNDIITNKEPIPYTMWNKIRCDTQHTIALISTTIEKIIYDEMSFINIQFESCLFEHVLFKNCIFINCSFDECVINNTIFLNSYFLDLSVCSSNLYNCTFKNSKLKKTTIKNSNSIDIRFNNVKIYTIDIENCEYEKQYKISKNLIVKDIKITNIKINSSFDKIKQLTIDSKENLNVCK